MRWWAIPPLVPAHLPRQYAAGMSLLDFIIHDQRAVESIGQEQCGIKSRIAHIVLRMAGGSGAERRRHRRCRCRPLRPALPRRLPHLWAILIVLHDAAAVADAAQSGAQQHLQAWRAAGSRGGAVSSCTHAMSLLCPRAGQVGAGKGACI